MPRVAPEAYIADASFIFRVFFEARQLGVGGQFAQEGDDPDAEAYVLQFRKACRWIVHGE